MLLLFFYVLFPLFLCIYALNGIYGPIFPPCTYGFILNTNCWELFIMLLLLPCRWYWSIFAWFPFYDTCWFDM